VNLLWGVFQERLGSTEYVASDGTRERFKAIPILNLAQAVAATVVAAAFWFTSGPTAPAADQPPFSAFFKVSLCHTIASPVGYLSLIFLPYPLLVLASSMKLIPVMLVGMLVKKTGFSRLEIACGAIVTAGVALYSTAQRAHHSAAEAPAVTTLHLPLVGKEVELSYGLSLCIGLGLIAVNLSLEGFTNAYQDVLYATRRVQPLHLMAAMNAWSVGLLALYLGADSAFSSMNNSASGSDSGSASMVAYALRFAQRHPDMLAHLAGFALCGAVAQIFIFECISSHGSFATTTVTISRKFVTVLLSVAFFGHRLAAAQWSGVLAVFVGLGIQLVEKHRSSGGGGKHGHGRGHGPASTAHPAAEILPGPGSPDVLGEPYAHAREVEALQQAARGDAVEEEEEQRHPAGPEPVSARLRRRAVR
jgi:UDP-galactose transporter B1